MIEKALGKKDLIKIFKTIGIKQGMLVEVHTSLKSLGYLIGGTQTFVDALIEVVGYNGTIIMPLQCGDRSEPSYFENPPITLELQDYFKEELPAFDKVDTDSYKMSKVVENMRRRSGSYILNHPLYSFVVYGKYARMLTEDAKLSFALDDESILGKLYRLKANCLLVGVDYSNATCMHLAEYRSKIRPIILQGSKIIDNYEARWKTFLEYELDSDDGFNEIGSILEKKNLVKIYPIENGLIRMFQIDTAVDEANIYFSSRIAHYK